MSYHKELRKRGWRRGNLPLQIMVFVLKKDGKQIGVYAEEVYVLGYFHKKYNRSMEDCIKNLGYTMKEIDDTGYCPYCLEEGIAVDLKVEDSVEDYHNPADSHGHGQTEETVLACPECDHSEPYEEEPFEE